MVGDGAAGIVAAEGALVAAGLALDGDVVVAASGEGGGESVAAAGADGVGFAVVLQGDGGALQAGDGDADGVGGETLDVEGGDVCFGDAAAAAAEGAVLAVGLALEGDTVGGAVELRCGELVAAVLGEAEALFVVVFQDEGAACESADAAADGVGDGGAVDADGGDGLLGDGATAVVDGAGVAVGLGKHGDVVGGAFGQGGGELVGAVLAEAEVACAVVLQDDGDATESGDAAADGVAGGAAATTAARLKDEEEAEQQECGQGLPGVGILSALHVRSSLVRVVVTDFKANRFLCRWGMGGCLR